MNSKSFKNNKNNNNNNMINSVSLTKNLLLLLSLVITVVLSIEDTKDPSRSIQIMNESGVKVNIYWINRWKNDELVLNSEEGILFGASSSINSFVTHEFELQEVPNSRTGECSGPNNYNCRSVEFQVNENSDQIIYLYKNFTIKHVDNKVLAQEKANDIINKCKDNVIKEAFNNHIEKSIEDISTCIEVGLNKSIDESNIDIAYQKNIRRGMSKQWMKYICINDDLKDNDGNTKEIKNLTYYNTLTGNRNEQVRVLHNRPESKIYLLKNFISQNECNTIKKTANSNNAGSNDIIIEEDFPEEQYIVGDDNGAVKKTTLSKKYDNTLSMLSQRIRMYIMNDVFSSNLKKYPQDKIQQEDFLYIEYNGKEEEENPEEEEEETTVNTPSPVPDYNLIDNTIPQFKLHCDSLFGNCNDDIDGSNTDNSNNNNNDYQFGDRIVSMIMYCDVPKKGGSLTFPYSGVHVKPKVGDAVFINYVDVDDIINSVTSTENDDSNTNNDDTIIKTDYDNLYTNHIGCPVYTGTKSVISQKIRLNK